MKLDNRVKNLERESSNRNICAVTYKAMYKICDSVSMPLEKAMQEAKAGRVRQINFPMSFNEEEAERASGHDILAAIMDDVMRGIKRDTEPPSCGNLILCTKPIVYAKQLPPKNFNGHAIGGNFALADTGEEFHQTQYEEILKRYGAGFIIVQGYDETKEPWWRSAKQ